MMASRGIISPIIIAIGVVVFFVVIFVLALVTTQTKKAQPTPIPEPLKATQATTRPTAKPTGTNPTPTPNSLGKTYSSSLFSIRYPQAWQVSDQNTHGIGTVTLFQPTSPSIDAEIIIRTLPTNPQMVQMTHQMYQGKGYAKTDQTVASIKATTYTTAGTSSPPHLQEIYVVFESGNTFYLIKLQYKGDRTDPQLTKLFSDMLATMQLVKQ